MSTTTAGSRPNSAKSTEYEVGRPGGKCSVCGQDLPAGTKIVAALRETPIGFERLDIALECWTTFDRSNLLAFWQTVIPQHEAKKKIFVDDQVLCELFERLGAAEESAKLNFRFVLGLILMRKRMLLYETSGEMDGKEIWTVRLKGTENRLELLNPRLSEQQVLEVSQQLGEILNEEL